VNHHITEYVSLITSLKEEIVVLKKQLEYQSPRARGPRSGNTELHRHHNNNNDEDGEVDDEATDEESIPHRSNRADDAVKRKSFRQVSILFLNYCTIIPHIKNKIRLV
jgi:hypothetical protein